MLQVDVLYRLHLPKTFVWILLNPHLFISRCDPLRLAAPHRRLRAPQRPHGALRAPGPQRGLRPRGAAGPQRGAGEAPGGSGDPGTTMAAGCLGAWMNGFGKEMKIDAWG